MSPVRRGMVAGGTHWIWHASGYGGGARSVGQDRDCSRRAMISNRAYIERIWELHKSMTTELENEHGTADR